MTMPGQRPSSAPAERDNTAHAPMRQKINQGALLTQQTDKRMAAVARERIGERIACNHGQAEHVIEFAGGGAATTFHGTGGARQVDGR